MVADKVQSGLLMWVTNGILLILIAVIGFMNQREYARNDDQECRLRTVEQAVVEIKFISDDVRDIKRMVGAVKP